MRQVRIQRQQQRHHHHVENEVVLPLDPRDPDVVRAKRLERSSLTMRRARAA